MTALEALRRAWQRSIDENPTTITITRKERLDRGGYYEQVTRTVGPFRVRIFQHGRRSPLPLASTAGEKTVHSHWALIADHTTDIRAGTTVTDEFEALGVRWRVAAVYPRLFRGQVVGLRVELEQVT